MSARHVLDFLNVVAARGDLLGSLKVQSKAAVVEAAADFGLPFTEQEFDGLIWNLELRLAAKRGEAFDQRFPLWQTMWGCYYLEYLVNDMLPSFKQSDFEAVLADPKANS
ncbi:MAG: hypothetical protein ACKVVP_00595 [Chloroflexota bacterium]